MKKRHLLIDDLLFSSEWRSEDNSGTEFLPDYQAGWNQSCYDLLLSLSAGLYCKAVHAGCRGMFTNLILLL